MSFFDAVPLIAFLAFLVVISGRIIFLKKNGVKVRTQNRKRSFGKSILSFLFTVLSLLWLFEIIQQVFFKLFSFLPPFIAKVLIDSAFLKIIGTLIISLALIIWITTLFHFKTSLRFGLDQQNQGKLITTGIFSVSRNPFFVSIDLYFLGIALILPSPFFIGFAVLAIVSIHFFILKEEKFLYKVYGEEYKKYTKKVGRYICF